MMLNAGINIWKLSKKNVLFVPLEMPRDKLYQKLLSRESGIPFDRIERPNKLEEKEWDVLRATSKEWNDWDHKFYIMDVPERVPVSLIKRSIEKNISIFKPDVVIVDYIANLVAEKKAESTRDDLKIGEMLKDLRHMGRKNSIHPTGFAIISGAQIGREALKRIRKSTNKAMFYSEDLRGSHEYSADADNIYAQMPDPQQPDKKLYVYVIKARYGRKTFLNGSSKAVLDVKPETSLIKSIDDSFFHNHQKDILAKIDDNILNFEDMLNDSSEEVDNNEAAEVLEGKSSDVDTSEFDNDLLGF
jgi:replicative DNA helicase